MKSFTASYSKDLTALMVARQLHTYMLPRNKIYDPWLPKGGSFSTTDRHMPKSDTFYPAKVMVYIEAIQQSQAHYTAN